MKKIALMACTAVLLIGGCSPKCIEDSGNQIERTVKMDSFDEVSVSGTIKVVLKQDSSYLVRLQADSNVMKVITAKVSGHELQLKLENGKYCGTDSIVVYVGLGELKRLKTDGMVRVTTDGLLNAADVEINASGSSDLSLNLNAAKLKTKIDGVGKLSLSGQAGTHELKTSGNVQVEAFNFVAGIYDINIDGTGKANINVLNDLRVKTSGSSEIYYKGNPKNVKEKKSGATKLEKVN
ncbi:head GIN domain-containing protein [Pedobacter sp. BAL39]|uniref:head GIN domain-containing protein n=1 Tax=Pedobacter sp. BAL39 TaxID=391596 RepID=UPI0002F4C9B0|nr:head GIN domain-containing protein [Pedobacter sp. BAL39]